MHRLETISQPYAAFWTTWAETSRRFDTWNKLRRDPHILGWLAQLRSHTPPLAKITLVNRVIRLHRLLEDLAWTEQLPALAHLLTADDVPRRDHYLPRSLTPNHDESIQQELLRRNDLTSNA